MHVIGQDHPGVDAKRTFLSRLAHSKTEKINLLHQKVAFSVRKRDGEEDRRTGNVWSAIFRHAQCDTA